MDMLSYKLSQNIGLCSASITILQSNRIWNHSHFSFFLAFWARKVTRKSDSYARICLHSNSKLNLWSPEGEVLHCAIMLRTCTHFLWTIFSITFYFILGYLIPPLFKETKLKWFKIINVCHSGRLAQPEVSIILYDHQFIYFQTDTLVSIFGDSSDKLIVLNSSFCLTKMALKWHLTRNLVGQKGNI